MLLKFCGMTRQEDLDMANELGANMCGFIFHAKSPRFIQPDHVAKLDTGSMKRVGVFTTDDCDVIMEFQAKARLDLIQLHGAQPPELAKNLGKERIIKVFWPQVCEFARLQTEIDAWSDSCAFVLLDAGKSGGGSGKTLAWRELAKLRFPAPWLLAGGLGPGNLSQAISECSPDGIDLNSGVETAAGIKSHSLMRIARNLI